MASVPLDNQEPEAMKPSLGPCLGSLIVAAGTGATVASGRAADTVENTSALASRPEGWTDLIARAGPDLKGWTRGPIPPTAKLKTDKPSQWSVDPKTGYLVCQGDG